ncbi:hypothetical protein [uncultured Aquimarina sp.]|uniref:hypothetical protein n=1 Tax=uncultured Aquimarina sp. TaxID=575652 RepID=UPI002632ED4E|nr:hypothetical protein [uncultured Aquimarina sp.]
MKTRNTYSLTQPVKRNWKKGKYVFIAILFCAIAFTPLIHTFLSKKIDREYSIANTKLHEGLNILDDTYEIEITDGKVTCFREYDSTIINRVFGWSNWRRFLLGGSGYFCLFFLTLFSAWIFTYKDRKDPLFQKTVIVVLSFFGLVAGWFTIYSLYPKPDIPYEYYYVLLFLGSILINTSAFLFIKWAKNRQVSIDEMKSKIRRLMKYISIDISSKYIKKSDKEKYLTDTLNQAKELNKK